MLATHLWVGAVMRQLSSQGTGAYIRHKGDADRGTIIVHVDCLNGQHRIFTQHRNLDGDLEWMIASKDDPCDATTAESYIQRAIQNDPDIWVVEIDDRLGHNPFS